MEGVVSRRDEIALVVAETFADVSRLPDWMQAGALGRDLRPLGDLAASVILPLVGRESSESFGMGYDAGYNAALDMVLQQLASWSPPTDPADMVRALKAGTS